VVVKTPKSTAVISFPAALTVKTLPNQLSRGSVVSLAFRAVLMELLSN